MEKERGGEKAQSVEDEGTESQIGANRSGGREEP